MGNYQICDCCGHLFENTSNRMCQECRERYMQIRSIVEKTPDITVLEVSRRTGVSIRMIHSFVRNGYFIMKEGSMETQDI